MIEKSFSKFCKSLIISHYFSDYYVKAKIYENIYDPSVSRKCEHLCPCETKLLPCTHAKRNGIPVPSLLFNLNVIIQHVLTVQCSFIFLLLFSVCSILSIELQWNSIYLKIIYRNEILIHTRLHQLSSIEFIKYEFNKI